MCTTAIYCACDEVMQKVQEVPSACLHSKLLRTMWTGSGKMYQFSYTSFSKRPNIKSMQTLVFKKEGDLVLVLPNFNSTKFSRNNKLPVNATDPSLSSSSAGFQSTCTLDAICSQYILHFFTVPVSSAPCTEQITARAQPGPGYSYPMPHAHNISDKHLQNQHHLQEAKNEKAGQKGLTSTAPN